ncbi:hypothetical protein ACT4UT_34105, partial [Bacillus sp. B-TM1]
FYETHPFASYGAEWVFCCPYLEVASAKNTLKLRAHSLLQILLQGQTKNPLRAVGSKRVGFVKNNNV